MSHQMLIQNRPGHAMMQIADISFLGCTGDTYMAVCQCSRAFKITRAVHDHAPSAVNSHYPSAMSSEGGRASELILESLGSECLDYSLRRLGLHQLHLAENEHLLRLGGRLLARLDHRQARDDELARLLQLLPADRRQRGQSGGSDPM